MNKKENKSKNYYYKHYKESPNEEEFNKNYMYNNDNQRYNDIIYINKDIIDNKNKFIEEYKAQNIKENNIDKDKNFFRESLNNIEKKIYFDNNLEFHNNEIRQNEQMKNEKEKTKINHQSYIIYLEKMIIQKRI